ncbi:mob-3, partial [Pristionchus pacificus]
SSSPVGLGHLVSDRNPRNLLLSLFNMTSFLEFLQVNKHKTFRPKKRFPQGTMRYQLHKRAEATLNSGLDLKAAVRLPSNENFDDWIAVHTVDFFNRINLLYGTISDACTKTTCPTMSGGSKYEYLWQDGEQYKKPTRIPAPDYVFLLMDWIEVRINDDTIFPSCMDLPFPKDFRAICKKILTRLFRVFVHTYIHHFDRIVDLGAEPHANTLYKHFYFFVTEHSMVSAKELEALREMTERLTADCCPASSSSSAASARPSSTSNKPR